MRNKIVECNGSIDWGSFVYFPERERKDSGWEEFSDKDIETMFELCQDPNGHFVEEGSLVWGSKSNYGTCDYIVDGMHISWMIGQGSAVTIRGLKYIRPE